MVEGGDGGMEFLDDRTADTGLVFTLHDDGAPFAVDNLFHQDVAALISAVG